MLNTKYAHEDNNLIPNKYYYHSDQTKQQWCFDYKICKRKCYVSCCIFRSFGRKLQSACAECKNFHEMKSDFELNCEFYKLT